MNFNDDVEGEICFKSLGKRENNQTSSDWGKLTLNSEGIVFIDGDYRTTSELNGSNDIEELLFRRIEVYQVIMSNSDGSNNSKVVGGEVKGVNLGSSESRKMVGQIKQD